MSKAQRWTLADLQAHQSKTNHGIKFDEPNTQPKPSKYRSKKTIVDSITFDSAKEARKYVDLRNMQNAGLILNLQTQFPVQCMVDGQVAFIWWADFMYLDAKTMERIYMDVKSPMTRKLPVYALKKKLLKICHGIEITET